MADGRLLTPVELRSAVDVGSVDTVVLAVTDMQGRLQGKRFDGRFFCDEVAAHGGEGCSYLLAVDVDMDTVDGYEISSWASGYGDFHMVPDLGTARMLPWHPATALVFADLAWHDGTAVAPSPRQVLRRQLDRLAERGWRALAATELEFLVFRDTYEDAWRHRYRDLTPANLYNVDYSLLGFARVEPLLGRIRTAMTGAGLRVESSKGECNRGQHEITFHYDEALATCDNHALYKAGAKEIAAQEGQAITFMAKFDEREGNSCHVHLSVRDEGGEPVFATASTDRVGTGRVAAGEAGMSPVMAHFLAGQLAALRELTLLLAPNVNSYKRFQPGSFAPTALRWGVDNRTCALRVVGHGPTLRIENRVPGGDVNPHLAVAALLAAGLHGVDNELPLEPPCTGDAYAEHAPSLPTSLREALEAWEASEVARAAFGTQVLDHYATMARVELAAFDRSVTDWERVRGFERL